MLLLLRDQLRFALTAGEAKTILGNKHVKVDNKVRTDSKFPLGPMDVVKVGDQNYRILLDVKGRMRPHKISPEEAKFKLLRVSNVVTGLKGVPFAACHDGRNVPYVDHSIKADDTLIFNLEEGTVKATEKFQVGAVGLVYNGKSRGRVGTITNIKPHPGAQTIVSLTDVRGQTFLTPSHNVFVIGPNMNRVRITLPKGEGVKKGIAEDRELRIAHFEKIRANRM